MGAVKALSVLALAALLSAAAPEYVVVMFYKANDRACQRDITRLKWSGNLDRVRLVDVTGKPDVAQRYQVARVPTYVIWERSGATYKEVFRTNDIWELDAKTKGKR